LDARSKVPQSRVPHYAQQQWCSDSVQQQHVQGRRLRAMLSDFYYHTTFTQYHGVLKDNRRIIPVSLIAVNGDIGFTGIRVNKDKSSRFELGNIASPCEVEIVKEPRHRRTVLAGALLDCLQRLKRAQVHVRARKDLKTKIAYRDQICKISRSRTPSHGQNAVIPTLSTLSKLQDYCFKVKVYLPGQRTD